jgi:hypothetical protein
MQRAQIVHRFSWSLTPAFVLSLLLSGCGEDMSQPKTIVPEELPKDKAKESQQYFTKQFLEKKGGAKKN